MLNNVIINGRICNDMEIKTFGKEKRAVLNLTIAVDRDYKNADGEYEADFIRCSAFGQLAEWIPLHFNKGDGILVNGRLTVTNKEVDGETRTYYGVNIDKVNFASGTKPKETVPAKKSYRK